MSEKTEKKMKDELEKLPLIKLDFTVPYDFFFSLGSAGRGQPEDNL